MTAISHKLIMADNINNLGDDVHSKIEEYRCDPEARLQRLLNELENYALSHGAWSGTRCRRMMTPAALMSMSLRLYDETTFSFFFEIQDRLVQWLVNVGTQAPFGEMQQATQNLALFLLDWIHYHRF